MPTAQPPSSLLIVFVRVFWMALGPLMLGLLVLAIIRNGKGWFTPADLWFLVILNALILARWAEFRTGHALNSMGQPAKPDDFRRYITGAAAIGLGGWVIANVIGNYVMPR